jgi:predicted LPLAT superfamily acyltransferase
MRLTVWSYRQSRGLASFFLYFIVAYFWLTGARMRLASRDYFRRLLGSDPGSWYSYGHFLEFAQTTLERLDFWSGNLSGYDFHQEGYDDLRKFSERGMGAVLLGAHLGGFDVLRALSEKRALRVNVLTHRMNSQKISSLLRAFSPSSEVRIIDHDPSTPEAIFELKKCVEKGEFVAVLGDRLGTGRDRVVHVPFLGSPAPFPTGPFILASLLECPVFLTFGLRMGFRRYDLFAEPFSDQVVLPRASREEALKSHVERYASRLEFYCRRAPRQWFNFYDFWRAAPC